MKDNWMTAAIVGLVCALFACMVVVALSGCHAPAVPQRQQTACELGCEHLREIGCPEGNGSADGVPCSEVCQRAVDAGFFLKPAQWLDAGPDALAGVRCVR